MCLLCRATLEPSRVPLSLVAFARQIHVERVDARGGDARNLSEILAREYGENIRPYYSDNPYDAPPRDYSFIPCQRQVAAAGAAPPPLSSSYAFAEYPQQPQAVPYRGQRPEVVAGERRGAGLRGWRAPPPHQQQQQQQRPDYDARGSEDPSVAAGSCYSYARYHPYSSSASGGGGFEQASLRAADNNRHQQQPVTVVGYGYGYGAGEAPEKQQQQQQQHNSFPAVPKRSFSEASSEAAGIGYAHHQEEEAEAACECGRGKPVYAVAPRPGSRAEGKLEPRWCAECPQRPLGSFIVNASASSQKNRGPKRCRCGRSNNPKNGLRGEPPQAARWCNYCPDKPLDAIDIVSKRCECGQGAPTFGIPLEGGDSRKVARYWCARCPGKPPEARDMSKKCECRRSKPSFGLAGEPKRAARWCSRCPTKPPEAVDVVNKRCECGLSLPSFGLPGEGRRNARWCSRCPNKPVHAVNVINKRCECGTSKPSLGLPGEPAKLARWCSQCPSKPFNAIDVINKRCECGARRPGFGLPGEQAKDARWCKSCPSKPENAVNIRAVNNGWHTPGAATSTGADESTPAEQQ